MNFQLYRLFCMSAFNFVFLQSFNCPAQVKFQPESSIEWAYKVVSVSSQFSKKEKSANQILGKPNVLPSGGNSPCAWEVKHSFMRNPKQAFIRVAFEKPVKAMQVAVAENYHPGAIEKIILYGTNNQQKIVYQNSPASMIVSSRMLNVFFEPTQFDVTEGELILRSDKVLNFEIDAFGISDNTDTIKANINVGSNKKYFYKKEALGTNINTQYDEIAPVISPDGKTIYFDRKFVPENVGGIYDEDDIWFSRMDTTGHWLPAKNIGSPLNTKGNNFVQSITPDGNTLLLGNIYEKGYMSNGVSISNKTKDGWSIPIKQHIENFENDNQFANYYLTNDNRYLLIAMETDSSYGGLDLFVCSRIGENNWAEPKNMGQVINTAANDFSPFLAADGVTMYYSTSGISGFGEEDIFMSRRIDDSWQNWTVPQNMGDAINTKGSDTKFTITASGAYIYLSSTENSKGLHDIFRINLPDEVKPIDLNLLTTHTTESENTIITYKPTHIKSSFDTIKGIIKDALTEKNIEGTNVFVVINALTGDTIARSVTNENGEFSLVVPKNEEPTEERELILVIVRDGYEKKVIKIEDQYFETAYQVISIVDTKMSVEMKVEKVIEFHNIYFDYGSAELNDPSITVLEKIIQIMIKDKEMVIELSAHTDCRADADYNLNLSGKRANNAKSYMVSKGIHSERIIAKGYGKTRLLSNCKDCIKCNEVEHAVNRRIEVKILKM